MTQPLRALKMATIMVEPTMILPALPKRVLAAAVPRKRSPLASMAVMVS